jgi:hypothetical protein
MLFFEPGRVFIQANESKNDEASPKSDYISEDLHREREEVQTV